MTSIPLPAQEIELPDIEWCMSDGVFIKQMAMDRAGILVPQHSHKYDHTSLLAVGKVRLWKDGMFAGDYEAPLPIFVQAGIKHTFLSLEPSVVYCIHRSQDVEITAPGTLPAAH